MSNKLNWTLGWILIIGSTVFPYGEMKINRISAGEMIYINRLFSSYYLIAIVVVLLILVYLFNRFNHHSLIQSAMQALIMLLPLMSMLSLSALSNINNSIDSTSRISLGLGFYLLLFGVIFCLSAFTSFKWWLLAMLASLILLVLLGLLNNLGLVKELINSQATIYNEIVRHLLLALTSALFAIIPGILLGYLSFKYHHSTEWIMGFVNLFQVAPTLSLLALVMLPLSALSQMLPWLASIGIKGIGFAPAFIVLTLYCLLPVVANTYAGFQQIDESIIISARGMGMTNRQVFSQISMPLASPAIVSGIRTAFTQNIGNAVLAGLVGGGGMGTIIFLGLSQSAPDLVILGAIPVVIMAVLFDQIFESFESYLTKKTGRTNDRYNPSH